MSVANAYIFGHPIEHTISPAMHNAAFAALGIDATYQAMDVSPDALAGALDRLRREEALGANLTIPHKEAALALLDVVEPGARDIGAVNTVRQDQGRLVGHNTDARGFLAGLREAGVDPLGSTVALLGAGGAARAIAAALVESRVAELFIFNRGRDRAVALARDLVVRYGAFPVWGLPLHPDHLADQIPSCDLVVNATSVGLSSSEPLLDPTLLREDMLVVDIVYNPPETDLLRSARAAGARTQNGLPMLVHQAAAAFEIWTGRPAPVDAMRAAAHAALALV